MAKFGDYKDAGGDYAPQTGDNKFFSSVYICGEMRTNDAGITEEIGKLQVRGVTYNKSEINGIIVRVKQILSKDVRDNNRERTECFSYMDTDPPTGWRGKICGVTRADRDNDPFCAECRSQLIVALIYTDASGKPIKDDEGKPIFIFVKGKGIKYGPISEYIREMSRYEFSEPFFDDDSDEAREYEKKYINNKRCVTKITVQPVKTAHGNKMAFKLTMGNEIPKKDVEVLLQLIKNHVSKEFDKKFKWVRETTNKYNDEKNKQVSSKEERFQFRDDGDSDQQIDDSGLEESKKSSSMFDDVPF